MTLPGRPATVTRVTDTSTPIATPDHTVDGFVKEFLRELNLGQGTDLTRASVNDKYLAMAHTVRDHLMVRLAGDAATAVPAPGQDGRLPVRGVPARPPAGQRAAGHRADRGRPRGPGAAWASTSTSSPRSRSSPASGNGGLGRLAACFADSLATLGVPAIGYGIRYEYGIFEQSFEDGRQVEKPDQWLRYDNPWLFTQREHAVSVGFGGHMEMDHGARADPGTWCPAERVLGVPHNLMVPGYEQRRVNTLRLWKARGSSQFNLEVFNAGDYIEAVRQQSMSENISACSTRRTPRPRARSCACASSTSSPPARWPT